jgi:hypothetical protein
MPQLRGARAISGAAAMNRTAPLHCVVSFCWVGL